MTQAKQTVRKLNAIQMAIIADAIEGLDQACGDSNPCCCAGEYKSVMREAIQNILHAFGYAPMAGNVWQSRYRNLDAAVDAFVFEEGKVSA